MVTSKFLNPKNDVAFRKIFGSEKHKDILIHFINDVLDLKGAEKIQNVTFLSPIQDPDIACKKESIVDVLCTDTQGTKIIVEMQVAPKEGFEKRAQYYASKAYTSQLNAGKEVGARYQDLKAVIFIAITDYIVFPDKEAYLSSHIMLDTRLSAKRTYAAEFVGDTERKNRSVLAVREDLSTGSTSKLPAEVAFCRKSTKTYAHNLKGFSFTFIELPKFKIKAIEELSTMVEKWCYFFKYASSSSEADVRKIVDSDLVIQRAYEALNRFNWSEVELLTYEQEIKRIMDNQAEEDYVKNKARQEGRQEGEKIGIKKGVEKGMEKGKLAVAESMLKKGYNIEEIAMLTGLSISDIKKLD